MIRMTKIRLKDESIRFVFQTKICSGAIMGFRFTIFIIEEMDLGRNGSDTEDIICQKKPVQKIFVD